MLHVFSLTLLFGSSFSFSLHAEDAAQSETLIKSGQKIAFLGDSITQAGAGHAGYCRLVLDGLKREGIKATGIFAGISGHKSNQMLARLEKDVINKKPDWMTLSCGVNDVWHGRRGVKLPDYKKNITAIVDRAQKAGIKVMILTATMIREDQKNNLNQQLVPYNAFLCELAREKNCLLSNLNAEMQDALKTFPADAPKGKQLTTDGVHMNPLGNIMMAKGILKSFGVPAAKLSAHEEEWKKIPGAVRIRLQLTLSQNEYEQMQAKYSKPPHEVVKQWLEEKKKELLKSGE